MFVICEIFPSFLSNSDVNLLKIVERTKVEERDIMIRSRVFLLNFMNILEFINIVVNICNIWFNSRQHYNSPKQYRLQGFARITGKFSALYLHNLNNAVKVT